jgi:hypothetical protein
LEGVEGSGELIVVGMGVVGVFEQVLNHEEGREEGEEEGEGGGRKDGAGGGRGRRERLDWSIPMATPWRVWRAVVSSL